MNVMSLNTPTELKKKLMIILKFIKIKKCVLPENNLKIKMRRICSTRCQKLIVKI